MLETLKKINFNFDGLNKSVSKQDEVSIEEPHHEIADSVDVNKKEEAEIKTRDVEIVEKQDCEMGDETISENDYDDDVDESDDHSLDSQLSKHQLHLMTKTFAGVPVDWHETIKEKN